MSVTRTWGLKLLFQPVLGNDGRFASITAKPPPVANLRGNPSQRSQPGNPVLGKLLSQVAQIVGQLTTAIDLAALGPGLPDHRGLAHILLRTAA